ncbi:uncharacterized protein [Halyomorpha halys]|uniref:uncharacterized protein isoform X2 n=1 Tax=Halyomorpha halys TaxID=286706 RepID=UPI0006D4D7DE|nr:uncharacterized protein LOC106689351 isoform X2 [Halyomorpha halys]
MLKTTYRKKLFQSVGNTGCTLKTQKLTKSQKATCEKKKEISRYFEYKKLITRFENEKQSLPEGKTDLGISLKTIREAFKYCNYASSKLPKINFKLDKVFDILYSTNIPPMIKSKKNVIIVIENDMKRIKESKMVCPDCLKEEILKEIKRKIVTNLKEKILLIRRKLVKGLVTRQEFIPEPQPNPGFLVMDDLVAPFPEMDAETIPVFSFAEDKPQERPKCKSESEQNKTSKKNTHTPTSQEIFYEWGKETLLTTNEMEPSPAEEQRTHKHKSLRSPQNVESFHYEVDPEDLAPEINYYKNSIEVAKGKQHGNNKEKIINTVTSEKNTQNRNLNKNTDDILNPMTVRNVVEEISLATLDLASPSVAIIPIMKPKEKGKRNIVIKIKNVPDCVDVIKIRSIMSSIYNACEVKKYSNYFLKYKSKPSSFSSQMELAKNRRKIKNMSNCMTSPNKYSKFSSRVVLPSPCWPKAGADNVRSRTRKISSDQMRQFRELRCYKKNNCYFDE